MKVLITLQRSKNPKFKMYLLEPHVKEKFFVLYFLSIFYYQQLENLKNHSGPSNNLFDIKKYLTFTYMNLFKASVIL